MGHVRASAYPTGEWTAQQFRMVVAGDQPHRLLVHDHDSIYSEGVDRTIAAMGLTVLRTPVRAPQANAFCERLIGTIRRECLDFMIPLNERHVRSILAEWVAHYNRGRPHASLGPGIPDPSHDCLACRVAIGSAPATVSLSNRSLAACTTRIVLSRWPHERNLKPVAVFADHSRLRDGFRRRTMSAIAWRSGLPGDLD
jgi:hypothetical protein